MRWPQWEKRSVSPMLRGQGLPPCARGTAWHFLGSFGLLWRSATGGWLRDLRRVSLTVPEAGSLNSGGQHHGVVVRTSQVQTADASSSPRSEGGQWAALLSKSTALIPEDSASRPNAGVCQWSVMSVMWPIMTTAGHLTILWGLDKDFKISSVAPLNSLKYSQSIITYACFDH